MTAQTPPGCPVARLRHLLAETPAGATDWGRDLGVVLDAVDVVRDAADSATRTGAALDAGVVDACLAPALTPAPVGAAL